MSTFHITVFDSWCELYNTQLLTALNGQRLISVHQAIAVIIMVKMVCVNSLHVRQTRLRSRIGITPLKAKIFWLLLCYTSLRDEIR